LHLGLQSRQLKHGIHVHKALFHFSINHADEIERYRQLEEKAVNKDKVAVQNNIDT
jgi:hypothetical protein